MASFQYLRNQFLFSEAYLFSLLSAEETDVSLDGIRQSLKDWLDVADFTDLDTALASFIEPVLQTLQFACQPPPQSEPKAQSGNSQSSVRLLYTDFTFQNPVGVCLAVVPSQDLSCTLKGSNFAEKLIRLLRKNDLKWGILTNGKIWRLYYESEPMPYETYFEVDLPALLHKSPQPPFEKGGYNNAESNEFSLFARFFGVRAFYSSDEREHEQRLDEMKRASEQATEEIGKHLREKIETILENICAGFVADEGKERFTEAEREEIHHNAIYLLYRIMFLLYAEARGLLPTGNPKYREKSLERLIEIAYKNQTEGIENPDGYELWKSLRQLCTEIDLGNAELEVAPYDGGLFDAGAHPYLSEHQMANAYLSPVLYALAYYEKKNSGRVRLLPNQPTRINYRDMSVRHLGTLYEGILEYKLFVAEEPMVVRPTKSGFQFLPEREAGTLKKTDRRIPIGGVYFAQNPGERKATGSYYTPEYIVEYIVQNTVGEKLKELKATLKQSLSKDLDALKVAISDDERIRFQRFIDRQIYEFVNERVLSFRVLDPAMGSGHFLVNATNAIADFITELFTSFSSLPSVNRLNDTDWENPELDTSTADWRRRVVESCIFGVDLNPLAVELSKLSLWITAAAKDRPLSFLDHHLKCGNSLIGAKLNELGRYPQTKNGKGKTQTSEIQMFLTENRDFQRDIAEAIRGYLAIEKVVTRQREDVETKKEKLETIERILRPYREICELHTGGYFENGLSEDDYSRLITDFQPDAWDALMEKYEVAQVLARTADRRFFHWELEFPEVFFEEDGWKENPGFDVVVSNPPWGGLLDDCEKSWFYKTFDAVEYQLDTYTLFMEKGIKLLRKQGDISYIVPSTFLNMYYFKNLRKFILEKCKIHLIVHLTHKVFEAVTAETTIFLFSPIHDNFDTSKHLLSFISLPSDYVGNLTDVEFSTTSQKSYEQNPEFKFSVNIAEREYDILGKIKSISVGLSDITDIRAGISVRNKYYSNTKVDERYKKVVRGGDINRYSLIWDNRWVCYDKSLENEFPNQAFRDEQLFLAKEKLIIRQTGDSLIATYDNEQYYSMKNTHLIILKNNQYSIKYILSLLNSKSLTYIHQKYIPEVGRTFAEVKIVDLKRIPIRRISFTTPAEQRKQLFEEAKELYLEEIGKIV